MEQPTLVFVLTLTTLVNWHRVMQRGEPPLLPRLQGLSNVAHELVLRLRSAR